MFVVFVFRRYFRKRFIKKVNDKLDKVNFRIIKFMIVIIVVFILCYFFNCILDVVFIFKRGVFFLLSLIILGIFLLLVRVFFINNIINFFIYLVGELKF